MKAKWSVLTTAALVVLGGSAVGCYGYGSPDVYVGVAVAGPYVGHPYPYGGPYGGWVGRPYPSPYHRYEDSVEEVGPPRASVTVQSDTSLAAVTVRSDSQRQVSLLRPQQQ
jgi:hypothetical protein